MLSFRFKLMVLRLLYTILEIHVKQMVTDPSMGHSWTGLMTDAKELMDDYEDQIDDLSIPQYIPVEGEVCESGGNDNTTTPTYTVAEGG
jgi:hypothetical protein